MNQAEFNKKLAALRARREEITRLYAEGRMTKAEKNLGMRQVLDAIGELRAEAQTANATNREKPRPKTAAERRAEANARARAGRDFKKDLKGDSLAAPKGDATPTVRKRGSQKGLQKDLLKRLVSEDGYVNLDLVDKASKDGLLAEGEANKLRQIAAANNDRLMAKRVAKNKTLPGAVRGPRILAEDYVTSERSAGSRERPAGSIRGQSVGRARGNPLGRVTHTPGVRVESGPGVKPEPKSSAEVRAGRRTGKVVVPKKAKTLPIVAKPKPVEPATVAPVRRKGKVVVPKGAKGLPIAKRVVAAEPPAAPAPKPRVQKAVKATPPPVEAAPAAPKKTAAAPKKTAAAKKATSRPVKAAKTAPAAPKAAPKAPRAGKAAAAPTVASEPVKKATAAPRVRDFNSSAAGRKAIDDYKSGKITRSELVAKQRKFSGAVPQAGKAAGGELVPRSSAVIRRGELVPRPSSAVSTVAKNGSKVLSRVGKAARIAGRVAGPVGNAMLLRDLAVELRKQEDLKRSIGNKSIKTLSKAEQNAMMDRLLKQSKRKAVARPAAAGKTASHPTGPTTRKATGPRGTIATATAPKGTTTVKSAVTNRKVHTVKRGDTLWGIARTNNTSVDALLKKNPIVAERRRQGKTSIFAGTKIKVK